VVLKIWTLVQIPRCVARGGEKITAVGFDVIVGLYHQEFAFRRF